MKRMMGIGVLASVMAFGPSVEAGIPTDQLKGATDRVLKLVQDPELNKPEKADERRKQIRAVANEIFDWQETGKRALARHWQARTPPQREVFSTLFADLVERSYVGKIERYSGDQADHEVDHQVLELSGSAEGNARMTGSMHLGGT